MIKEIKINNFQSHKDSVLELDPGVNIIVGKTDNGKTAILRALRWLITNRPGGDAFRSTWGGETSVSILTEDHELSRIKDKAINRYALGEIKGEKSLAFDAFGTDIPEEIKEALNVNEINLQSQFDQPFLLNSSPGEVASHFNKIAHLNKIDTSLKKVNQWIRAIEQDSKNKKEQLLLLQEDLKSFDFLDKMEADIEILESMDQQKIRLINSGNKLKTTLQSISVINKELEEASLLLPAETLVNDILSLFSKQESLNIDKRRLTRIIQENKELQEELEFQEDVLKIETPVTSLLDLYDEKENLEGELKKLNKALYSIRFTQKDITTTEGLILEKTTLFQKNMPNICPLCNQKIK